MHVNAVRHKKSNFWQRALNKEKFSMMNLNYNGSNSRQNHNQKISWLLDVYCGNIFLPSKGVFFKQGSSLRNLFFNDLEVFAAALLVIWFGGVSDGRLSYKEYLEKK